MASLNSPHVCKVHGGVVVSDTEIWFVLTFILYSPLLFLIFLRLVMEYLPGGSLHDFLHSRALLNGPTKFSLAYSAALAVNYLHTRTSPLLHRDIKSHNFLVKNGCELVLIDFGLSKTKEAITKRY
jgi:serine/threonine protein kinase